MKRNYKLGQRLMAYILLFSFFLQSCTSFSKPFIPIEEHQAQQNQREDRSEVAKQVVMEEKEGKKLIAQGGHIVAIHEQDGQLQAIVEENLPEGFNRQLTLPVYEEPGFSSIKSLIQHNPAYHKHHIHVCPPEKDKQGKGYVYVGKRGLMGGGPKKRENKIPGEKNKKEESDEDEEGSSSDSEKEESDFHYFSRCEYYTRYVGTSHFAMDNCEYWGTYFRSTGRGGESGRFTRKDIELKTFKNLSLNIEEGDSYNSRTGTFYSPYKFKEYRKMVEKPEEFEENASEQDQSLIENTKGLSLNSPLYEELLNYRNQICLQVQDSILELLPDGIRKFEVLHHNEYPCLIVRFPFIQHLGSKNAESWNKLFIAYYLAIANREAEMAGIPIEMVIRSSFGHLLPSIDVTGNSFRINVGVVPTCYVGVIAKSLKTLQNIIINKLETSLKEYQSIDINEINKQIKEYNKQKKEEYKQKLKAKSKSKSKSLPLPPISLPKWEKEKKCYEIFQLPGDSSGKKIICQITRKRIYMDLLADYVAEELDKQEPDFTLPIVKMLEHLKFTPSVSMDIKQSHFHRNARKWSAQENILLNQDDLFWLLIKKAVESIGGSEDTYNKKVLLGLYSKLEKENKAFIIRSASTMVAQDGLGSDSEHEEMVAQDGLGSDSEHEEKDSEVQKLYAKKLTVNTGMMAINVAHYLARYYLKKYLKKEEYRTECKNMYFETEEALKLSKKNQGDLATINNKKKNNNPSVLFFDLNHCDVLGDEHKRLKHYIAEDLVGKKVPIIVMDCTSSTPSHIKCAIKDAVVSGVKLILLVSSGLKNEQLGADNNPYGTVRIVTLDEAQRDELYKEANNILKKDGGIPATAHKIRKGYKKTGLTLTNQQILNDKKIIPQTDYASDIASAFTSLYDIIRYRIALLEQLNSLSEKTIKIPEEEKKLIGEGRASELEQETVIGYVENFLREMVVDELRNFIKKKVIDKVYDKEKEDYLRKYRNYTKMMKYYKKDIHACLNYGWDYEGPRKPQPPRKPSIEEVKDRYGNLNDLSNLIKVSKIKDDDLSQMLYDRFIEIDGMEDIMKALKSECNTLGLDRKLVSMILEGCDVQFYNLNPTKEGFLLRYLKESIEQRFSEIEDAFKQN